jgi:hypothetical protein
MGLLGCAPDGRRCRQCGLFLGGFSRSPGPAQFEDGGVKLPATSRENLSPAAGREDEANLRQRFLQEPASE